MNRKHTLQSLNIIIINLISARSRYERLRLVNKQRTKCTCICRVVTKTGSSKSMN
eukprot:UN11360